MSKKDLKKHSSTHLKRADIKRSSVSRRAKKAVIKQASAAGKPKKRFIDYFLKDEAEIKPKNQGKHRQKKEVAKPSVTVTTRPQAKGSKLGAVKKVVAVVILKFRSVKKAYLRAKRNTGVNAKKQKLYLSYFGAGTVVIAVTLIFILAPIGKAKDTDVKAAGDDTTSAYIALSLLEPEPEPTPIRTTMPEMTRPDTDLEANGTTDKTPTPKPDPTPTPKPKATPTPKPDPTPTPKPDPTPTPKPDPTPTPKPDPTPEPEPDPTPEPEPEPNPTNNIDEIAQGYKVEADKYYNEKGFSTNYYEYTEEDVTILARVIHRESKGESLTGKIAVGNVVMNRVLNPQRFGNTIKAVVVDATGQFSYSADTNPSSECIKAARLVLDDQNWVVPQHIYFFKSSGGETWGSHTLWKQIGNHYFYAHNYSGRNTNGEIPDALFKRTYEWPRFGCVPSMDVWRIQSMLAHLGYGVSPDKYFGKGTGEALEKFQADVGIKADGVAGPTTLKKLINKYGLDKYTADFVE